MNTTSLQIGQAQPERQPYEKPGWRSISLVADQVLGVGCKSPTQPGPESGVSCIATTCSAQGS
jgi:hypothetical protein